MGWWQVWVCLGIKITGTPVLNVRAKAPSRTRAAVREGGAETGDGSGKIPTTQTNAVRSSPGPRSREKHGAAPQPSEPNRDKNTHTGVRRPSACGGQAGGVSALLSGLSVWSCFHQRVKTTAGKMMRLLVWLFCWTLRGLSSRHGGKHDGQHQCPHRRTASRTQINKQVYCDIRTVSWFITGRWIIHRDGKTEFTAQLM